ncbi:MAG: cytochrome c biogenesis protein CcdA [Armatimonadetes bacterium]|nr:cytochrome c biogenesis protein CcdA [Armatimonadota bacterium]
MAHPIPGGLKTGQPHRPLGDLLLALGVTVVLLILLAAVRNRAESSVADLAALLPFGWAFAAGMVASVNPCGFFMLPAYLSYQLGTDDAGFYTMSSLRQTLRALGLGGVATGGFVVVLGLVGALIAASGQRLIRLFPYAGIVIGVLLAGLGLWMLVTRRTVGIAAAKHVTVTPQRNLRNVFLFGIAYATGSLSCTLPIFLLVVGGALAGGQFTTSLGQFVSYALGMGSVLVAVTIGAALFRGSIARSMRRVLPYVDRISALFLLGAGLYLIYYWVWTSSAIL